MLSPESQAIIDKAKAQREAKGLKVTLPLADGTLSDFYFQDEARRDDFIRRAQNAGRLPALAI